MPDKPDQRDRLFPPASPYEEELVFPEQETLRVRQGLECRTRGLADESPFLQAFVEERFLDMPMDDETAAPAFTKDEDLTAEFEAEEDWEATAPWQPEYEPEMETEADEAETPEVIDEADEYGEEELYAEEKSADWQDAEDGEVDWEEGEGSEYGLDDQELEADLRLDDAEEMETAVSYIDTVIDGEWQEEYETKPGRVIAYSEVNDKRFSVPAQESLMRMSKNPARNAAAVGLLEAVKGHRLAGIHCANRKIIAERSKKFSKEWWTVIPKGEDAVLILSDPVNPLAVKASPNEAPLIAFRRELDRRPKKGCGKLKENEPSTHFPEKIDVALIRAWETFQLWQGKQIGPCTPGSLEGIKNLIPEGYCKIVGSKNVVSDLVVTVTTNGKPMANASVRLVDSSKEEKIEHTKGSGTALFPSLPPQTYHIIVEKKGFKKAKMTIRHPQIVAESISSSLESQLPSTPSHVSVDLAPDDKSETIQTDPMIWFLPKNDFPNPPRSGRPFTEGNEVRFLIDGQAYMNALYQKILECDKSIYLAGWRITGEQYLNPHSQDPLTVRMAILNAIREKQVKVRAMLWCPPFSGVDPELRLWHLADNRLFCEALRRANQEAILDNRLSQSLRNSSSHHQKFVILEFRDGNKNTAYIGGIDLCFDRWDTPQHNSPPVRQKDVAELYIKMCKVSGIKKLPWLCDKLTQLHTSNVFSVPAWHDVQVAIRGHAVTDIWSIFRSRWNDRRDANDSPLLSEFHKSRQIGASSFTTPAVSGSGMCSVQVLQTLPCDGSYPFATRGENTIFLAYRRAINQASRYIYIEDQYFWPNDLIRHLKDALRKRVFVIVVVARDYDLPPPAQQLHKGMRKEVMDILNGAGTHGADQYFHIFHLQRNDGQQIYVHSKTMIIDDAVAFIGSANFNHRSMTTDTELQVSVVDAAKVNVPIGGNYMNVCQFAHEYRCALWGEHLQLPISNVEDPILTIKTFWKNTRRQGRVFRHTTEGRTIRNDSLERRKNPRLLCS